MSILSAQTIRKYCGGDLPLISPFFEQTKHLGTTFGLSSAGYDIRVNQVLIIEPNSMTLASSVEYFDMPSWLVAVVHDKSTWARRGIVVQNTVLEPGWRGYLTLEISNHSLEAALISKGSAIAQIVFHRLDEPTKQPYGGKYQDQRDAPQPAIFERD
jgi:dCTP deaminase